MTNRRLALVATCSTLIVLYARPIAAQDTSTPEERTRWVEITRKLETLPLDKETKQQGEWALKRVIEVHDVHVALCASIINGVVGSRYKFRGEITRQLLLASAAYVIEHPDSASDLHALNLSAMESVLKTYKSILSIEPKARSKELDKAVKEQDDGKLPEYVKELGKSCFGSNPQT